jgi:hypothetical protein
MPASAYARARREVAAANTEFEEFAAQFDLDIGGPTTAVHDRADPRSYCPAGPNWL